jgi:hypothetical protein
MEHTEVFVLCLGDKPYRLGDDSYCVIAEYGLALLELADYNTVRARAGEPDLTVRKMWLVPAGEEE